MSKILYALMLLLLVSSISSAQPVSGPMLIEQLTVDQTRIAFSYAGDIWVVDRKGGEARRLTTHAGDESFPVFSPDGSTLAFSRQIGGDWDVYVMPSAGGEARRLTYMPENDLVMNWTPDGKHILFRSHRNEENVFRFFTIALDGVMPAQLPLPQAYNGSYSADGARIAYVPMPGPGEWRYYRGGSQTPIWIATLSDGRVERLPRGDYNDKFPMWVGNRIYFTSDRTGIFNLYVYDLSTKQTRQLTSHNRHGIRTAVSGGGAVAYVHEGRIHLYDPSSNQDSAVNITVAPDMSQLKARAVNAAQALESVNISANGESVIVGARGEAFIADRASDRTRNLTQTPGVAEREPAISPDGRFVAYFSDEGGEYQLHVRAASGEGQVRKISIEPKPTFYRELIWSPDSKKIAFSDKRLTLWYADVERGTTHRVDSSTYSYQERWSPEWSPDGRWLAYSKHLPNRVRTVYIFDAGAGKAHQITDGHTHSELPVFDRNGKYLYFASSPNAGTSEFGWGVLNGVLARPLVRRSVHLIVLQTGVASPILPNGQPNADVRPGEAAPAVRIDFDGIGDRVIDLPLAPRDYADLVAGKPGTIYAVVAEWPPSPGFSNPSQTIYKYDLSQPNKFDKMVEGVGGYELSADGGRLLYSKRRDWFIVPADAPAKADEGKLNLKLDMTVDPQAEWKQMYREAWRLMRDWFYDPNHHGQNLVELEQHFSKYLPSITRRSDLNILMRQMLGHISVSHLGVGGGDTGPPVGPPSQIGLLGADYEIDRGRYRFKTIYRSSRYNDPSGSVGAPLDQPGISVREGEYLLGVDGQNIEASKNLYSYFEGKAQRATKITVGPNPNGEGARTLTVFPAPGENGLRRANWAERNRRLVERMSGGKLGYIFVEDYGLSILNFIRGLSGYSERQGLIIDQRFNGGGITPDYLIEWLKRKPLYYYMFREGEDIPTPVNPGPAVKVLITNEWNGSAAETFAFMYKIGKVGPIVGWRTDGGGIGPYVFTPQLIDGGRLQIPNRAAYNPDGSSWGIENRGVSPDVEVEITPQDYLQGRDPQLERAVQVALEEMKKSQTVKPVHPKYPVHK